MNSIRILLTNPGYTTVENDGIDYWISGTRPEVAKRSLEKVTRFEDAVANISSLPGEYTLIAIDDRSRPTVYAHRGITSSFDVYLTEAEDGTIIVGDHFREVVSEVPVDNRTVPETVGVDHLLFGTRPNGTYVEEVDRLGHGETLTWELDATPQRHVTNQLTVTDNIGREEALRRLHQYFDEVLQTSAYNDPTTMMSGGVDSTLIASYLGTPETVSATIDSPEFEFEREYANRASELLNTDHNTVQLNESTFVDAVEKTVDRTGHPLQHLQTTLMNATVAESGYQTYFNGQLADGIFGVGSAPVSEIAWYTRHISPLLAKVSSRAKTLQDASHTLQRKTTDPAGEAMNFVIHSDDTQVKQIFSDEAVAARKRKRLDYTGKRIQIPRANGYGPHMHVGHFIDFFQDNTVTPWRHAAHAHGKELQTPFGGKQVLETVLSLPPRKRYTYRFKEKHLLKSLLKKRMPEYDTEKQKGSSGLPVGRYLQSGPLANIFDQYPLPDFIPDDMAKSITTGSDHITWYAFTYAVWRDRILRNDDLDHFESTTVIDR